MRIRRTFTTVPGSASKFRVGKAHGLKVPRKWVRTRYTSLPYEEVVSGDVTADLAVTEAADTLASESVLVVSGALARTEAADTVAASGGPVVSASLAATETADTLAASGGPVAAAALSATESADAIAAAGEVLVAAALAATEAGDALSSAGTVESGVVEAALSVVEADDTCESAASRPDDQSSGGWWIPAYERHLARLLRRKFRREDDEEAVQAALEAAGVELPEVVTDPRADDLRRLKALVSRYEQLNLPDSRRVSRAVAFARHEKSREALARALHEIAKQVEEDEISLMVALAAIA